MPAKIVEQTPIKIPETSLSISHGVIILNIGSEKSLILSLRLPSGASKTAITPNAHAKVIVPSINPTNVVLSRHETCLKLLSEFIIALVRQRLIIT